VIIYVNIDIILTRCPCGTNVLAIIVEQLWTYVTYINIDIGLNSSDPPVVHASQIGRSRHAISRPPCPTFTLLAVQNLLLVIILLE
jgi:hypothetical protein